VERKEDSDTMTVIQLMEYEFKRIIGHDGIKAQLRTFHRKVQLDEIRAAAGRGDKPTTNLYHMIFSGPPGITVMPPLLAHAIAFIRDLMCTVQCFADGMAWHGRYGQDNYGKCGSETILQDETYGK
jgi:hypothetical protein